MGFSSRVKGSFSSLVRQRGRRYLEGNRVEILEGTESRVSALVQGESDYLTVLEWDGGVLRVACGCPDCQDDDLCRHVWATGLAGEQDGLLTAIRGNGRVEVITDPELLDKLEEDIPPPESQKPRRPPAWVRSLERVRAAMDSSPGSVMPRPATANDLCYVLDRDATLLGRGTSVAICRRRKLNNGEWGPAVEHSFRRGQAAALPDPMDRRILSILLGASESPETFSYYRYYEPSCSTFSVVGELHGVILPLSCATGRFYIRARASSDLIGPLAWDDGPPWQFWLQIRHDESGKHWVVDGRFEREGTRMPLKDPLLLLCGGYLFTKDRVARLDDWGLFEWIGSLRKSASINVPVKDAEDLLAYLWSLPRLPPVDWPEELRLAEIVLPVKPHLTLRPGLKRGMMSRAPLRAEVHFRYGDTLVRLSSPTEHVADVPNRRVTRRDLAAEKAATELLVGLRFRPPPAYLARERPGEALHDFEITQKRMPRAVRDLVAAGWHVEAEGKLYKKPGELKLSVSSGIDWFDVSAEADFEGKVVKLSTLLAALKRGENTVVLDDGTLGMVPESWLEKFGLVLGSGKVEGDAVRFRRSQVGLLDALLAAQPAVSIDETFAKARDELRAFDGIRALEPRGEFRGELRPYQKEGLGWLEFLRRFGFGGCLADDMGLGKTVQVLALLESRRAGADQGGNEKRPGPSLVVVPRSLVFNWKSEAEKFAPRLRVLDNTGAGRQKSVERLADHDVVITTYGTLRRDIPFLKDARFDYVILDEAQAVKNSESESAKAVRLLQGKQRLALSGTPIENHLGELWSLFEFLNPGMLGTASFFKRFTGSERSVDSEALPLLRRALRPFILRRTKEQVAKDLPEKLEQTILCDLGGEQRRLYDELRDHCRAEMLGIIEKEGLGSAQFQVLERLLRLRQAACHPGLIDKSRRSEPSAKLDLLLAQLEDVLEEGHKALVFSQFTSFLAIVRDRLDKEGVEYEYLDGKTRDRAARVKRFQEDPTLKLFLVSLKAGGLGLNLTAAEYVFLLDPWWNPAVEAQAIDRAHRIGQTNRVFAYRLVARGTVEEKVLELQRKKRELADAIISGDGGVLRKLTKEDLELLLS